MQVAYESNKFMLPIRLGTLNARGKQELYVYASDHEPAALRPPTTAP